MALAVATSPTIAHGAQSSSSIATPAFTIPARTVVVVMAPCNASTSGNTVADISDNAGDLGWTRIATADFAATGGNGYATAWWAYVEGGASGVVVTITTTGSTSTTRRPTVKAWLLTGGHKSSPVVGSVVGTTATVNPTVNYTQTVANSLLMVNACEWNKRGVPTSTNLTGDFFDQPSTGGVSGICGHRLLDTTTGTEPFNLDEAGTSTPRWQYVAFEVRPALTPTVGAGADVTGHVAGAVFARAATEADNGGTITARAWTITAGPAGVGTTLATASALSWTPTVAGTYTVQYAATNAGGTGTDTMTIAVAAAPIGVPLLPASLGPNARLIVEIAWGADPNAAENTWAWTDVTADVRQDPGISTSMGRADEASTTQPATCTMTLDNTTARYSLGPQSPNYPNVRRNAPVRVRVDPGDGVRRVVFLGYAVGFTPTWNLRGNVRDVQLVAGGTLRRLIQGSTPVLSPFRRGLLDQPDTVAYWPCEEGRNATSIAAVVGSTNMAFAGSPNFGDSDTFDSSLPIPELNGAVLDGQVDPYPDTGKSQVRVLFAFPTGDAAPNNTVLFRVFTSGTAARWDALYTTGGNFALQVFDRFGAPLATTNPSWLFGVNGTGRFYSLELTQNGSNIDWRVGTITPYRSLGSAVGTVSGRTAGTVVRVVVNPGGGLTDTGAGHVIVQNDVTSRYGSQAELDANAGEYVTLVPGRLSRLCQENGITLGLLTGDGVVNPISDRAGPQRVDAISALLRDAEAVDQGILYDGVSPGLTYATRRFRENRLPAITVPVTALTQPFAPTDDDQRTRNKVQVSRTGGSSAVVEDVTGPLGTAAIGVYDTSETVNAHLDESIPLYAGWMMSQGTVEGYRYPSLTMSLRANPTLAAAWLDLRPGHRVDVTGLGATLTGHPDGVLSLLVEGKADEITAVDWVGTLRCSPYAPWRIGLAAATTGDTAEYLARADTAGAVLSAAVAAGATSISVATSTGPLWTTRADDFPYDLEVGGRQITVTACSDGTSPQVMTIAPAPAALASGAPVRLWNPTRTGL